jgi:hypothetical protein
MASLDSSGPLVAIALGYRIPKAGLMTFLAVMPAKQTV